MYFNIKEILKIEKECHHPTNRHLDSRDHFDLRTGTVLSFSSFQKFYIQDHFDVVHSLNLRDIQVYKRHEEISGEFRIKYDNIGDKYPSGPDDWGPPDRNKITEHPIDKIWLEGWQEHCHANKFCSLACGHNFRKFVHEFKPLIYGYLAPELKYRFSALEGQEGNYGTEVVGDVEAIQYWRDSLLTGINAVYQKPIEELAQKLKKTVRSVFYYFSKPQDEDVNYLQRHEPAESVPKSQFEPSHRHCVYLQTKKAKYCPSKPWQRAHYEDISQGTQTTLNASHWGQPVFGVKTWPYYGEIDNNTGLTVGAPEYYIHGLRKRKREQAEEGEEADRTFVSGGDNASPTTWGLEFYN